jgi:[protein-PII] uridylyltransferase
VSFRSSREELLARVDLQGGAFCSALAVAADEWLSELLSRASSGDPSGVALVAVGGYGRGELCPYSDLDVVLVHESRRDVAVLADAVWYPVWDEGIRLDHSVRRPAEVLDVARADLRAQLGLLDGRRVAGDDAVVSPLLAGARDLWNQRSSHWLPILAEHVAERHTARGDVAFLLEPDLKEAHGGLRDIHAVYAAAVAVPSLGELVDLSTLKEAGEVLVAARVELHRATGRATDRLLLQEQDHVAATLGYEGADALMAAIAEAGRTVAWASDDTWRRRSLWNRPQSRRSWRRRRSLLSPFPGRRRGSARADANGTPGSDRVGTYSAEAGHVPLQVVEPGIAIAREGESGEEVALDPGAPVSEDVTLSLRLAAVAAERALPIGRASLETLASCAPQPGDVWPTELREALVRVLAAGQPAIAALEALDQKGLLKGLLPEWQTVRNRPQRNAYHLFTVDRHLLEAAAAAAPLALRVSRPDLLLLAAFLHDIGKGHPGDHTVAGVEIVTKLAPRMGLSAADAEVLVTLVRNHLLLADLATRRDLDDPATVAAVVEATRDRSCLELLVALTEADSLATGPSAWGPWKAGLVADLAARAASAMAGEPPVLPAPSQVTDRHRALMRQVEVLGRSIVAAEVPTITVVARDRPGLLSAITGVFALQGLDVRSANAAGDEGFAVDVFTVEPARGHWPDWERVADQLEAVLRGTFPLSERLAEQERVYAGGRRPVAARPVATQVTVDNTASATCSVVDVRAEDSLGLLHRITASLFDEELDVVAARVSTLGHEVVDAFYIRDKSGGKVIDPERIRRIDHRVQAAVAPRT